MATSHSEDVAESSTGYHPYLVCSTAPDLSGQGRYDQLVEIFEGTPNVVASDLYYTGNQFHNNDDISCGTMRAYNDTVARVYDAHPESAEYMKINPLHPSMKMLANTVDTLKSWFDGSDAGDIVSVEGSGDLGDDQIRVKTMGMDAVLCPGVQDFEGEDVPDDEIADNVKGFLTKDGGDGVGGLSFYHHRANGMDGNRAVHTERIDQWSAAITKVTNWTKVDGSNLCLDVVINESMDFRVEERQLGVYGKLSNWEINELATSLGFSTGDMETCIWYMMYGLALNPMVCTIEPKTALKTLCKDGSSDLSKCPNKSNSSSKIGKDGQWRMNFALAILASFILVV